MPLWAAAKFGSACSALHADRALIRAWCAAWVHCETQRPIAFRRLLCTVPYVCRKMSGVRSARRALHARAPFSRSCPVGPLPRDAAGTIKAASEAAIRIFIFILGFILRGREIYLRSGKACNEIARRVVRILQKPPYGAAITL